MRIAVIVFLAFNLSSCQASRTQGEGDVNQAIDKELTAKSQMRDFANYIMLDINGIDTITFRQILRNHKGLPLFCYKISRLNCNSCIEEGFRLLDRHLDQDFVEVILVGSNYSTRLLGIIANKYDIRAYLALDRRMDMRADSLNMPYYFSVLLDGSVDSVFIPELAKEEEILAYFDKINSVYYGFNTQQHVE